MDGFQNNLAQLFSWMSKYTVWRLHIGRSRSTGLGKLPLDNRLVCKSAYCVIVCSLPFQDLISPHQTSVSLHLWWTADGKGWSVTGMIVNLGDTTRVVSTTSTAAGTIDRTTDGRNRRPRRTGQFPCPRMPRLKSKSVYGFLQMINPFLHDDTFWCPWETNLLKTLWEKEKLLVTVSPFPTVFSTQLDNFLPFSLNFKLLSANSLSLEESKICHLVMG